jgi:hypothetical protein
VNKIQVDVSLISLLSFTTGQVSAFFLLVGVRLNVHAATTAAGLKEREK